MNELRKLLYPNTKISPESEICIPKYYGLAEIPERETVYIENYKGRLQRLYLVDIDLSVNDVEFFDIVLIQHRPRDQKVLYCKLVDSEDVVAIANWIGSSSGHRRERFKQYSENFPFFLHALEVGGVKRDSEKIQSQLKLMKEKCEEKAKLKRAKMIKISKQIWFKPW